MNHATVDLSGTVTIDFDEFANLFIMGEIGTGKTWLLNLVCSQLYIKLKGKVQFFGLDPKGLELTGLMQSMDMPVASRGKDIFCIVKKVRDIMLNRYHELSRKNLKSGYFIDDEPIFLVVDELIFIQENLVEKIKKKTDKNQAINDFLGILTQIAVMGRQARVFLIIASQYLTVDYLPTAISENLLNRVVLGVVTPQDLIQVFGKSYDILTMSHHGLFKSPKIERPYLFYPYQYDPKDMLNMIEDVKRRKAK